MKKIFQTAVWMLAFLGWSSTRAETTEMPTVNLDGRVVNASGAPVKDATIFVFTARPKEGTSPFCPSCYPDCRKTARSDESGRFAISGLSSQLVFRLLVVAKEFTPKFVPDVAPDRERLEVVLDERPNPSVPPEQIVRGRIVNSAGAPIHGAVVEVNGVSFEGGRTRYGGLRETDPLAVTDENGEFMFATKSADVVALKTRISARALANQAVELAMGKAHMLTMTEGAMLAGRVVHNGEPLANVSVGLSAQNRAAGEYVGNFEVGTDANGRFLFTNLPPKTDYYFYGKMETVGKVGTIPVRPVHVGRDGQATELGDVTVRSAHRLAGRVVLADGGSIPEKTRLLVSREEAWDSISVELGPEGEFDVTGVPAEAIALTVRVRGYQMSEKNRSYESLNRRIVGRVDGDIAGLELLMEKRPDNVSVKLGTAPVLPARKRPAVRPRDMPLRGAEKHGP